MSATSSEGLDRIALLEEIRSQGKTWDVLAPRYGVTNVNPPWKTSLVAMCDCLGRAAERFLPWRSARPKMSLADTVYSDVPAPERQLLALAHTMLERGLVDETELAEAHAEGPIPS